MKYTKKRMVKTIMTDNAELFDLMFNNFMETLSKDIIAYDLNFNNQMNKLCVQIIYESSTPIPESIPEAFEMIGKGNKCSECPQWKVIRANNPRGNKKYFHCDQCSGIISAESWACEWFYRQFKREQLDDIPRITSSKF